MSTGIPVIKFLFKDSFKVLNEALNLSPGYAVEEFSTANDLSTFLSTEPAALIIASLRDKNDLIQIATFVKLAKKVAKDTAVKTVVINFSGDRTFDKAIAKLGIQDLIEVSINTKALKFKLDFWMKSLNAQVKKNPNASTQNTVKTLDQSAAQDKKAPDLNAPVWQEPLDLEDDIWILKNDSDCKKVLAKWLIRLLGPSPYIGQWNEVKGGVWRFDIKETEKELFCPNPGSWFFHGDQKPDFVWKENIWMITGENFELYYKDGTQVHTRLKSKEKVLTIAKNSLFAKTKEPVIIESFDKELVFKREAQKLEDLEGKNKTDQINGGPLSGKNKAADKLGGNLAGKTEGEEAIQNDNLSGKGSTAKAESKFWGGKNSADAPKEGNFTGPKADGPNAGADLSRERKDNEHQKYYKNHNEAEKYEAAPEKEHNKANGTDKQAGNLAGKSSTDDIPKHYDNKQKEKAEIEAKKKDDDYSGKSHTDKLKSHLGTKEKAEAEKKEASDLDGAVKAKAETPEDKERERKEKEEKIFKERLQTAERNKTEQAERERKAKEDREEAKAQNEKQREEKETAALKKNQAEAKNEATTRKNQVEEKEAAKTKTAVEKNWEGDQDYEMSGQSETERLSAHYKSKKQDKAQGKESEEEDDSSISALNKKKQTQSQPEQEARGAVLPFGKKEEKKPVSQEENDLEEITRDAKVISVLIQNGKKADCNLDDFFDDTIIFSTEAQDIESSAKVYLDLLFKFEKDTKLKMEGNVLTVEGDGEGNNYVTVQVSKESTIALNSFMKLYELRQRNANEFLKKVKGL